MRHFHSYGPINCKAHFCVKRKTLINQGVKKLVGNHDEEGGHYFTIWAPRQTGKTWLMKQLGQKISQAYPEQFTVYTCSLGDLRGMNYTPSSESMDMTLPKGLSRVLEEQLPGQPLVKDWAEFRQLFSKNQGLWQKQLILLIDEVDTSPPALLDLLVGCFREMYLNRDTNWLHGLALVGVRAVLGIESQRGSPFNIQKSLHIPNLTHAEVTELYRQYQEESSQAIDTVVVEEVYQSTKGQPGLVSWFGELLTEKYNPGSSQTIGMDTWKRVWHKARFVEPNNTIMNLIAKARMSEYQDFLVALFSHSDRAFSFHEPKCSYLFLHGIITSETLEQPNGEIGEICRFASPFIQDCLYYALNREVIGESYPILPLQPLDELSDVFAGMSLNLPALLQRYQDYLHRLKVKGLNPWKEQPSRKTDLRLTEAVGHFHLFTWLQAAVGRQCVVSPEFPTGNGKVDLHLRCEGQRSIIEIKSFTNNYDAKLARQQAAKYAKQLGLPLVTVALFVPVDDEDILEKLSVEEVIEEVVVQVVAIGWT